MFQVFNKILKSREPLTEDESKKVNSWMFCKFLASDPRTIQVANVYNLYSFIPLNTQIQTFRDFNANRIQFIKYIPSKTYTDENIKTIARHFNVSYSNASEYMEFLSSKEIASILQTQKDLK